MAKNAGVAAVEVEVVCSSAIEHRRRIASRSVDIPDLPLPRWQDVRDRDYEPWSRDRIVLDTAGETPAQSLRRLLDQLEVPSAT
ncbi:hypothetical protein [Nocardia panacis]|uniref:hypothetical protein n=1 Tax=Nocardia panacis TaxID=2340916 RepID=UPI00193AB0C7|nr:hypothetical protein [Nocardia panacis]